MVLLVRFVYSVCERTPIPTRDRCVLKIGKGTDDATAAGSFTPSEALYVPPRFSEPLEDAVPHRSESGSDAVSYYSFEIDEYSSDSEVSDAENTAFGEELGPRRGDAPGFPIYVESDSEDDDLEEDV
ncbi:hypothetical protein NUW54_g1854 [Trametes sanguinea]|uniref:Uncharacterized protein n=1 Tax=Trametes sanguinea TaxID=158606 RepID=A0ACC1Q6Z5_9APHY|nr:hypothetical protein NUW54_g1854 [Trametes sanguinea]